MIEYIHISVVYVNSIWTIAFNENILRLIISEHERVRIVIELLLKINRSFINHRSVVNPPGISSALTLINILTLFLDNLISFVKV